MHVVGPTWWDPSISLRPCTTVVQLLCRSHFLKSIGIIFLEILIMNKTLGK
jgi:hypothetical protein